MERIVATFVLVLGVPGALALIAGVILTLRRMTAAASVQSSWARTLATITEGRIEIARPGSQGLEHHLPRVRYSYTAEGRMRSGSQLRVGAELFFMTERGAASFLARYPSGEPVTIRVDPTNPDNAVLEPRATYAGWPQAAFVFAALSLGALLWLLWTFLGPRP